MVIYWWRYRRAAKHGELVSTAATDKPADGERVARDELTIPRANSNSDVTRSIDVAADGPKFTLFIYALLVAYLAVLVRCIYR